MCQDKLHDFLVALPKCEHHMHLEGSLEPDLLFELATRNNITLPQDDPSFASKEALLSRYKRFTSLDDFLHYYFIGMSVLITSSDFESLAYAYFLKASSQNVRHAEVFFDPQAHTTRGVSYQTVLTGFVAAQAHAKTALGLTSELIVCMLRDHSLSSCRAAYTAALPDLQSGLIRGLGLSSTEKGHPPSDYSEIYADALAHGISHLTAHAGEEADVSYMTSAVHDLRCVRVDHGIKLRENVRAMQYFADNRVLVTMCPLSNLELRCVKNIAELPVRAYLDAAVPFSLNSDDPAYFGGYILENYCAVQEAFGLGLEDWVKIVESAIDGSWCGEERKGELRRETEAVVEKYKGKS